MRAISMTILGASAILFGTLTLIDHSASAKSQNALACKHNAVEGEMPKASIQPNMATAKNKANLIWAQKVKQVYGSSWAYYYYAKNKNYTCVPVQNDVACKLSARPCKLVTTIIPLEAYPPVANPRLLRTPVLLPRPSARPNRPQRIAPPVRRNYLRFRR